MNGYIFFGLVWDFYFDAFGYYHRYRRVELSPFQIIGEHRYHRVELSPSQIIRDFVQINCLKF